MTLRMKYILSYTGGMILWSVVFYLVGHRMLNWPFLPLGIAYFFLAVVLGAAQIGMYFTEHIDNYRGRLRRRTRVIGISLFVLGLGTLVLLVSEGLMSWPMALSALLLGSCFGVLSLSISYRIVVRLQGEPGSCDDRISSDKQKS